MVSRFVAAHGGAFLTRLLRGKREARILHDFDPWHTTKCQDAAAKRWRERVAWETLWPAYCRTCDGSGVVASFGSYEEPDSVEPCPVCTEESKCPRCGQVALNEGEDTCFVCHWTYMGVGCELPPHYECEGCRDYAHRQVLREEYEQ